MTDLSTPPSRPARFADSYHGPSTSLANRTARGLWGVAWLLLVRPTPRPFHAWRALVLRTFGATLGPRCRIYANVRVWAPWNLVCEDHVAVADGVVIYNPALVRLASHATISQDAYLCGATHDIDDPGFPMVSKPIEVGRYAWIAARATVCCGVRIGEGAVLGLGGVATRDLAPWTVHGGVPARPIRQRCRFLAG